MIKYTLVCDAGHDFESWFASGASYESQVKRGYVVCPFCQSAKVEKAVMAPHVARTDRDAKVAVLPPEPPPPPQLAMLDERQKELRGLIRELREKIVASSDDVGDAFPEEARKMHDGETPVRSIRGKASFEDARSLLEEGVPVMPIPDLPEERN